MQSDRDIAPFILNLHWLSWQGGLCPENAHWYQIMQVSYVTLLTHKSSICSESTNPSSSDANEIKQLTLSPLFLLHMSEAFVLLHHISSRFFCAVQLKCLFLSLFPITNLLSFPAVTESLNMHEYSFYSFESLNMFWIIEIEEASVPCQVHLVQNKKFKFFCKIQNPQPLSPTFNCWRKKEDCVWRFIGTNYFTQTFFPLTITSGW